MEARMVTLQSEFRQELDGPHSTVLELNPEELMARMTKISHLEQSVNARDEGIQEIKKLLLTGGKESTSSSNPRVNLNPQVTRPQRPMEDRNKAPCTALQTTGNGAEYLPRRLELLVFE